MNALFDRALLQRRRARASAQTAGYLLDRMAADLAERLLAVNREFALGLAIGGGASLSRALAAAGTASKVRTLIGADLDFAIALSAKPAIVCDDERLPVAPASLDLILSAGVLQWANDLPGALVQARRALMPDGLFLAALVGGDSLMELRQAFLEAEAEIEGGASPRVAPMVDVRDLGHLLQRAGFALPVADLDRVEVTFETPLDLLRDLRAMGATNILNERRRAPMRRATLMRAMEIYARRFRDGEGRARATFEILHASGWAPHASQQMPLKPGSATHRLADALGAVELGAEGKREA
jgi:SAM-dependent methyltransferase